MHVYDHGNNSVFTEPFGFTQVVAKEVEGGLHRDRLFCSAWPVNKKV